MNDSKSKMNYPKLKLIKENPTLPPGTIDAKRLLSPAIMVGTSDLLQVRLTGKLDNRGFYLNDAYDWIIVTDDRDELVLVPLTKK